MRATIQQGSLILKNEAVSYKIKKHHKSRRLRITINALGEVVVTIPRYAPFALGRAFANKHAQWVEGHIHTATPRLEYREGLTAKEHFKKYQAQARQLIHSKLVYWNNQYGFTYGSVTIRNQASRWGSCSRQNNLNFNYRLILLDDALVDYVIVHELCHLQEHNHSKQFWKLVAQTIPDYVARRARLRKH